MRFELNLSSIEKKRPVIKILVIGPGLEIGGVEKSLLGLLQALVDQGTETDLFLFSHTGTLLPTIDKAVRLLPEETRLARIHRPVRELVRQGNWYTAIVRTVCKAYGALRRKRGHTADISLKLCHLGRIRSRILKCCGGKCRRSFVVCSLSREIFL